MIIETGTDDLLATISDGVATITLNRPDRLNALSAEMLASLGPLVGRIAHDPEVGAVVITGAGRAFCAGGDVKSFHDSGGMNGAAEVLDPDAVRVQQEQQRAIVGGIRALEVPVLAVLGGAVAGAGIGLALAADFRLGSEQCVFATAFVGVGLPGDFGTAWQLHQLVGRSKALELVLMGDRIDAPAAERAGLLNWVVPEPELQTRAAAIAHRLVASPRTAITNAKRNARDADHLGLLNAMDLEVVRHHECSLTDDHRRAVAAYAAQRAAASQRVGDGVDRQVQE